MVIEPELPNRPIINNTAVRENIVPIPIKPAENILTFELGRNTSEILGNTLKGRYILFFGASMLRPFLISDLTVYIIRSNASEPV